MGCKWGCERFFDLSRLFSLTRARVRVRAKEVRPVHHQRLSDRKMRRLSLYAALALCVYGLPATAGERFGQWSLDQPGDFVFALSFKRSLSSDDRTATSELAFVCNQEEKYVAVLLIPLDGTFKNRQNSIPVVIQKTEEQSDTTDLMQRWENGPSYIFLESPDRRNSFLTSRTEKPKE
jgi:hypothetical protein